MSRIAILAALAVPAIVCAAIPAASANPDRDANPPCDPEICGKGKLSAEELREDKAITYRLNRDELAYVQRRDAERAEEYRRKTEERDRAYEAALADYERRMAEWREAVRRCEAGEVRYCEG